LPSYREGFGMTIIESAACGIPTVASKIYGITDAVTDGRTGLLYPVGSVEGLTENLLKLINNDKLRKTLGCNARTRALEFFPCERITFEMISLYGSLIDRYQNERFG
jgi:glycosyltransferase involved in cell wall biosynthesis